MKRPSLIIMALAGCFLASPALAQSGWTWTSVDSGVTGNLLKVSMLDGNFGVAVGENRTVLKWDGSTWSPMAGAADSGFEANSALSAVTVINSSLVLIGGSQGSNAVGVRGVSVWDGTAWDPKIDATGSLGANSVTGLWTDRNGLILTSRSYSSWITRYDGDNDAGDIGTNSNWSFAYNGGAGSPSLLALGGKTSEALFAVGTNGSALFSSNEGVSWTNISSSAVADQHWYSVAALSGTQAWMGSSTSSIATWDGNEWTSQTVTFNGKSVVWRDIFALDANNVWAVGDSGAVKYYDGSAWSDVLLPGLGNTALNSISYDGSALWVVGRDGSIYQAIPEPSMAVLGAAGLMTILWRAKAAMRK